MNLSKEQKNTLAKILGLIGNQSKLALYIFGLEENFATMSGKWEELLPQVEKLLENVDAIKPVKGKDYYTDEEFNQILKAVLEKIPVPKDINEAAIIAPVLEEIKKSGKAYSKKLQEEVNRLEGIIADNKFDSSPMEHQFGAVIKDLEKKVDGIKMPEELTGEAIVDKINDLPVEPDKQIEAEHIKGLEKLIRKIAGSMGGNTGGGGFSNARELFKSYDLSPFLDGVTKTFNMPAMWYVIGIENTSFPATFRKVVDFTNTTQSITFTDEIDAATSLAAGQTITVYYVTA